MREDIDKLLAQLHFKGIAQSLERILAQADAEALPATEVVYHLLQEEWRYRQERSLAYRLNRYDALLIDELGNLTLKPEQVNAFFKLMDLRYGRRPSIITTNIDYPVWYGLFERKPLVDALLDRLQHHCLTIRIDGPSLRVPDNDPDPLSPKRRRKTSNNKK